MSYIKDFCTRKGLTEESICPPHCPLDTGIVRNANNKRSSNQCQYRNSIHSNHQLAKNNHSLPKMKTVSKTNYVCINHSYVDCENNNYPYYHNLSLDVLGIYQCRRCPVCGCARCICCHHK